MTKYRKIWNEVKYLIKTINGGKVGQYKKKFMKIKFDSDDNLPLTLFRMGERGWQKAPSPPLTSFPPVTSTNVGINPKHFLTLSFNPFDRLV